MPASVLARYRRPATRTTSTWAADLLVGLRARAALVQVLWPAGVFRRTVAGVKRRQRQTQEFRLAAARSGWLAAPATSRRFSRPVVTAASVAAVGQVTRCISLRPAVRIEHRLRFRRSSERTQQGSSARAGGDGPHAVSAGRAARRSRAPLAAKSPRRLLPRVCRSRSASTAASLVSGSLVAVSSVKVPLLATRSNEQARRRARALPARLGSGG